MDNLRKKYSKQPIKGDIYNLQNLKVLLDDLMQEYFTKGLSLSQCNLGTDIKIVIGLISTVIAVSVTYLSVYTDFNDHKFYLMLLCSAYFVLNAVGEMYAKLRGNVFKFNNAKVYTSINAPNPIYTILVYSDKNPIPKKYSKSVCDLFDEDGRLQHTNFLDDLDNVVKG